MSNTRLLLPHGFYFFYFFSKTIVSPGSRLPDIIFAGKSICNEKKSLSDNILPRKKDDILSKAAFEELFPYLLRFCFQDAPAIFDFKKKFVILDKESSELFPELKKKGGSRFVDMLVKVFLKNGKEEWILVHIEIQGGNTKDFPRRMFQYWYRIYDRYSVDITALAIFTGNKNQAKPSVNRQKNYHGHY